MKKEKFQHSRWNDRDNIPARRGKAENAHGYYINGNAFPRGMKYTYITFIIADSLIAAACIIAAMWHWKAPHDRRYIKSVNGSGRRARASVIESERHAVLPGINWKIFNLERNFRDTDKIFGLLHFRRTTFYRVNSVMSVTRCVIKFTCML